MRSSHPLAFTIFDPRIQPIPETGCWIWMGSMRDNGYGQAGAGGTTRLAHRVFYEKKTGKLESGKPLHHICNQPLCCNPDHLQLTTAVEHGKLHAEKGFSGVAKTNAAKAACGCGSAFVFAYGQRYCRVCARLRSKKQKNEQGYAEKNREYQRLWAQQRRAAKAVSAA